MRRQKQNVKTPHILDVDVNSVACTLNHFEIVVFFLLDQSGRFRHAPSALLIFKYSDDPDD